jgi:DNA-binding HxlR family transcriptional regulator
LGVSLLEKIEPLICWANENHAKVQEAREAYVPPPVATPL